MIPQATKQSITSALQHFDTEFRNTQAWENWYQNMNHGYAIVYNQRQYPVKFILEMASGIARGDFSAGEARQAAERAGFTVEPLEAGQLERLVRAQAQTGSEAENNDPVPLSENDANEGDTSEISVWQKQLVTNSEIVRRVADDLPSWLTERFGNRLSLHPTGERRLRIRDSENNNELVTELYFNEQKHVYVWMFQPLTSQQHEWLSNRVNKPNEVKELGDVYKGYRWYIDNESDYETYKTLLERLIELPFVAFVMVWKNSSYWDIEKDRGDGWLQKYKNYSQSYAFSSKEYGAETLINALRDWKKGEGPEVHIVFYYPSPYLQFEGIGRIHRYVSINDDRGRKGYSIEYTLLHDFDPPLVMKKTGNAVFLLSSIEWLKKGLQSAFQRKNIRKIKNDEYHLIVKTSTQLTTSNLDLSDAAFNILFREVKKDSLFAASVIQSRIVEEEWVKDDVTIQQVSKSLLTDKRFHHHGNDIFGLRSDIIVVPEEEDMDEGDTVVEEVEEINPFVVIHGRNFEGQIYGQTYTFSLKAGGAPRKLLAAVHAWQAGSRPVNLIIYRPDPHYAFTGYSQIIDVSEQGDQITLTLAHSEFLTKLELKNNAYFLRSKLAWLRKGLPVAFAGQTIREITPAEYQLILEAANQVNKQQLSVEDAAYNVLAKVDGGALRVADIRQRAIQSGWLTDSVTSTTIVSALRNDVRFESITNDSFMLRKETKDTLEIQDIFEPQMYLENGTRIWRVTFDKQLWQSARLAQTLGIGHLEADFTQTSVKRLRQIAVGDRIVVYMKGGWVGGVGVVTHPYYDIRNGAHPNFASTEWDALYPRRIGVAWSNDLPEPINIMSALREESRKSLYNRFVAYTHTVLDLKREEYMEILRLLEINDPRIEIIETEPLLLSLEQSAFEYLYIVQEMEFNTYYKTEEFEDLAADGLAEHGGTLQSDLATLVDELHRLRFIKQTPQGWQRAAYTEGDIDAVVRLGLLSFLTPSARDDGSYQLVFLQEPQRLSPWLADAFEGIEISQILSGDIPLMEGESPATQMYNRVVRALRNEEDMPDVKSTEPLPRSPDFEARLTELAREVLVDPAIVKRIYRSLMTGRHVVLSGPPGTGKTLLATKLPQILWYENADGLRLTTTPDKDPVLAEGRQGYLPMLVTATEDWGVRDVVGGIAPRLDQSTKSIGYEVQYGHLTRAILRHYIGTNSGRRLPTGVAVRSDVRDEDGKRYRGTWLVIDEFTRAPVDAAFGPLLTTLSGGDSATLAVPTGDGSEVSLLLPADFRIIGTLNSYDRHFLNQMSEALKRRFDFIDIPPPNASEEEAEHGIAAYAALRRLNAQGFTEIESVKEDGNITWQWQNVLSVTKSDNGTRFSLQFSSDTAEATVDTLQRIFAATRVFRQLGTAQLLTLYHNLFGGVLLEMSWDEALDTALADTLADQLQVLTRDERKVLDLYLRNAATASMATMVDEMKSFRMTQARWAELRARFSDAAGDSTFDKIEELSALQAPHLGHIFRFGIALTLPVQSQFIRRIASLERGL